MPCDSPYFTRPNGYTEYLPLPCGKCPPCKLRRVNEWAFRIQQEVSATAGAHFITLTYDDENLPRSNNNLPTLSKKDCQDFLKRLRYRIDNAYSIKYYLAAEYGSTYKRPHYHLILLNLRSDHVPFVHLAWGKGSIDIGDVTHASIRYVLKYIDKPSQIPQYARDDREPEFSLKSQYIGKSYINDRTKKFHRATPENTFVKTDEGYTVPLPKYYRDQIYNDAEKKEIRKIIVEKLTKSDETNQQRYKRLYGNNKNYSYDRYLEDQKASRYHDYYSQQKPRDNADL